MLEITDEQNVRSETKPRDAESKRGNLFPRSEDNAPRICRACTRWWSVLKAGKSSAPSSWMAVDAVDWEVFFLNYFRPLSLVGKGSCGRSPRLPHSHNRSEPLPESGPQSAEDKVISASYSGHILQKN